MLGRKAKSFMSSSLATGMQHIDFCHCCIEIYIRDAYKNYFTMCMLETFV